MLLAFLLGGGMLFTRLGGLALCDPDEGRNASVAREMAESGSWIVPTYDGLAYLDKPAFYFKAVGLALSAFGASEASARLPSALFGLGVLGLLFLFCRRAYDVPTAAAAVIVVATSPLFLAFSRLVIFDMALAFFVCASVMAGYLAEEHEDRARRRWYLIGAVAAGLGTLVKGPVGFLLPGLVLVVLALLERRKGAIRRLLDPLHLAVFLGIVLPWFLLLSRARPDFPHYGLVEESLRRFTTPAFNRNRPFWYYGPVILGACFAWSLLLPGSIAAAWRKRSQVWNRADRLFLVWTVVVVLFFSISHSKRGGYVLTVTVTLGGLIARVFSHALANPGGSAARLVLRGTAILTGLALTGALLLTAQVLDPSTLTRWLGVREHDLAWLAPRVRLLLVAQSITTALGLWAWRSRRIPLAFATFTAFLPLLLGAGFGAFQGYAEAHSSRALARALTALDPAADPACLRRFPNGLPFYLGRPVALITERGRELTSNYVLYTLREAEVWPEPLVPLSEVDTWLEGRSRRVALVTDQKYLGLLEPIASRRGVAVRELIPGWWVALIDPGGSD